MQNTHLVQSSVSVPNLVPCLTLLMALGQKYDILLNFVLFMYHTMSGVIDFLKKSLIEKIVRWVSKQMPFFY